MAEKSRGREKTRGPRSSEKAKQTRGCDKCNSGFIYYTDESGKSGISRAFAGRTLDKMEAKDEETKSAIDTCRDYCENGKEKNLIITGRVGTGKTSLAIGTANLLLKKGIRVRYVGYRELVGEVKPLAMDPKMREKAMAKYKNIQVLVLDDLYKSNITDADLALIYEIINHRYMNCKSTVVTSEKTIKELMNIDEAIASRLAEGSAEYYINLQGKNKRMGA